MFDFDSLHYDEWLEETEDEEDYLSDYPGEDTEEDDIRAEYEWGSD